MRRRSGIVTRALFYVVLAAALLYTVLPFYWMLVSSLKQPHDLFATPVTYWPRPVTLGNYGRVFTAQPFARNILNSVVVAAGTTVLALALGTSAAYALGRYRFRGKQALLYAILGMSTFPQISILGGMFVLVRALGLYNTPWALIFSYTVFTLPFTVWVLTSFVREVPVELDEAAVIDGATPWQVLRRVVAPLIAPGAVAAGLIAFINAWNEFLFALTFTVDSRARTVPVAIALFSGQSEHELPWGQITAASVIVSVPVVLLALAFQRRIVKGLTAGSVKG